MFHPLSANKFKNIKVLLTITVSVKFKHCLLVQLQIVGERKGSSLHILG